MFFAYVKLVSFYILFKVDMIKLSTFPVLKRFLGTDEGLELKVILNEETK